MLANVSMSCLVGFYFFSRGIKAVLDFMQLNWFKMYVKIHPLLLTIKAAAECMRMSAGRAFDLCHHCKSYGDGIPKMFLLSSSHCSIAKTILGRGFAVLKFFHNC